MKILFLSDNFPPEVNAPATRTYQHCRAWVKAGAEVTVVTSAPNFPQGKIYSGYRNRLVQRESVDGITVIRVWTYIAPNAGVLRRVADYFSFTIMAFFASLRRRCDVIVATSPQFFTTFAAWALSKLKRKPWVFELRDLWPESISAVDVMRNSWLIAALERIELGLYRDCDKVIAVTEAFKSNLVRRGIPASKVGVITNGVDLETFTPRPKDEVLAEQLGLTGKFVVGYIGTHGMAHGLHAVIDALTALEDPNIHFLFIGDGAEKASLLRQAERLCLSNATFLDPVSKSWIPDYIALIDCGLVHLRRHETFKSVIPSKLFELAGMEKPILLGVDGQAREIVERYNAGLYFEPENKQALLAQTRRMAADKERYARLQVGCRKLAAAYDRTHLAAQMLDQLRATAGLSCEQRQAAE